jgi:DNA-binding LacI/PurR family transcriptional regulator
VVLIGAQLAVVVIFTILWKFENSLLGISMTYSKSNSCDREGNQVFLCHSSHDKESVREIGKRLENLGIDAWIDEKEILPGESLIGKIQEGLVESRFVLAFCPAIP